MIHRHPSFFPLVLGVLTVILVAFMIFAFSDRDREAPSVPITQERVEPVSEDAYRERMKELFVGFDGRYEAAEGDVARLVLVEDELRDLLAVKKIPAVFKDLHLELAFSLNLLRDGLRGSAEALVEGRTRLRAAIDGQEWLR